MILLLLTIFTLSVLGGGAAAQQSDNTLASVSPCGTWDSVGNHKCVHVVKEMLTQHEASGKKIRDFF